MRPGSVARLLSGFALFFSLSLLVPLAVALAEGEAGTTRPFLGAIAVGLAVAAVLRLFGWNSPRDVFRREGLAMVGLAWFLAGALAALPFVWSGSIPSFVDALFESVSGLTSTGATVLGTGNPTVESLPHSILLWRSITQWMGGIGIVLVFIVLMPGLGVTGSRLLSSEQMSVADEAVRPRLHEQARRLLLLYVVLTTLAALAFWVAGMPAFDAVCHSFTTMATGGFSTHNVSIGGYQSLAVELVAVVFMFIAGCNFLLLLRALSRRSGAPRGSILHSVEFRVYLGITIAVTLAIAINLWMWGAPLPDESLGITRQYDEPGRCLRDALFQTVSILTTTGYSSADFQAWPRPAVFLLWVCMFIGGCTGSTTGGLKVLRVVICAKLAVYALRHFVRPHHIEKLKVGSEVIPDRVVSAVLGLLVLWIASVGLGALVLVLDPRLDMTSALTASASLMGCVGPATGEVVRTAHGTFELVGSVDLGPYAGFGELTTATKLFMSLLMVLGRLEILAPLAILTPRFWQR